MTLGAFYINYNITPVMVHSSDQQISTDQDLDFSASYAYDLNGNLTHVTRKGMLVGGGSGTVTDISLSRQGNRTSITEFPETDEREGIPLEGQPQLAETDESDTYDADGNLTDSRTRGIYNIEWSVNGNPLRVTFDSGEEIVYRYSATGEKLSERYLDADSTQLARRDFLGSSEFKNWQFHRRQVEGGYLDGDGAYHVYAGDYQGNVLGVIDTDIGEAEQYTDYYPYGLPHATAYAPEVSRRKFGGKEYTTEFGFNSCDFGARPHSPLLGSL